MNDISWLGRIHDRLKGLDNSEWAVTFGESET